MPGNAWRAQAHDQCNREQTAGHRADVHAQHERHRLVRGQLIGQVDQKRQRHRARQTGNRADHQSQQHRAGDDEQVQALEHAARGLSDEAELFYKFTHGCHLPAVKAW